MTLLLWIVGLGVVSVILAVSALFLWLLWLFSQWVWRRFAPRRED